MIRRILAYVLAGTGAWLLGHGLKRMDAGPRRILSDRLIVALYHLAHPLRLTVLSEPDPDVPMLDEDVDEWDQSVRQ